MFKTIANAWKLVDIRKKLLFTLLIIIAFRIGSVIPVPFLNMDRLDQLMNTSNSAAATQEEGDNAPGVGRAGTEGDEGVHVRRATHEAAEALREEMAVEDEDCAGEKQLHDAHCHVVRHRLGEPRRQRPAEHHMAHRRVHEDEQ